MIDEAFLSFETMMEKMLSLSDPISNERVGVRSHIYEFEISSPVELDVSLDEHGNLKIGTVPPLYRVDTSYLPSFHQLRFRAEISRGPHGE